MKTKMKIFAVVAVMIAATGSMMAQISADATANILDALGCTNAAGDAGDLNFGDIVPGTVESTVAIASDGAGARTLPTGDAVLVASDEGSSAQFDLVGLADAVVDLTVDPNVTLDNGGDNMTATLVLSAATATLTGGAATFYVGGTLTVGAAQATGSYTGTFDVTADYQ